MAIESVLSQTYRTLELIAIDDGSTDRSLSVLRSYANRDGRIRVVSRPNTGYSVALNEALGLASGGLIARMDADDVAAPERFESQSRFLAARPECVAVGCRVRLIDSEGEPLIEPDVQTEHDEIVRELLRGHGGVIPHPGLMVRASAIRALGGYRVEFEPVEDLDLYLRLSGVGRLANLPEILLDYRQHERSVSYRRHKEQLRQQPCRGGCRGRSRARGEQVDADFTLRGWVHPIDLERYKIWFWRALCSGRTATARRYALRIMTRKPLSLETWKIAYCSVRGH